MKKKLQVFVSSTFTDMRDERQAAVEAILQAGHIPAGMELFAAGDESQLEIIHRWIDESDVFLLILGGRYGSIEPKSGKSYIEREYDYATKKGMAFFTAVMKEEALNAKLRNGGLDVVERKHPDRLEQFRTKVTTGIQCGFFEDIKDLKLIILQSLSNFERNEELSGWIRASDTVDPVATLEQFTRLERENEELRRKVTELEASAVRVKDPLTVGMALREDARTLLVAAEAANGYILYVRYSGGASIQTGGKNFIDPYTPREEARWKEALAELLDRELIESRGTKGESFALTHFGYKVAEEIQRPK